MTGWFCSTLGATFPADTLVMETVLSLPALILFALLGSGSVKVTSGGRSRLVERLGKFDRELQPGLSIVIPVVERVVSHESLKERVLDIPPQLCITRTMSPSKWMQSSTGSCWSILRPITPSTICKRPW